VQRALHSLARRHLIRTYEGAATRSGSYVLNFTRTCAIAGPCRQHTLPLSPPGGLTRRPSRSQPATDWPPREATCSAA
jgi:hypothetical protein